MLHTFKNCHTTGKVFTLFLEKDNVQPSVGRYDNCVFPPIYAESPLQQSESALRPRGLLSPNEPSKQERELHDRIHLPHRQLCSVCAQAKGKLSPHPAIQDRTPVIQIDFAFMSTKEQPGSAVTIC